MDKYWKLIAGLVGALALFLKGALADGAMTSEEWTEVSYIVIGAVGVAIIPNTTVLATAKTWVMAVAAGALVLKELWSGGLQSYEVWDVVIAILTAAGVYVVGGAPLWRVVDGSRVSVPDARPTS